MIEKLLRIGDKIELTKIKYSDDGTSTTKVYVSQLLDIVDDSSVNIAVPIEAGHLVPLEVSSRYDMRVLTINGMYACRAEVEGRYKQDNFYFLSMKILSDFKKDQRRQYFRLEKIIPMQYHKVSQEEDRIREILNRKTYRNDSEKRVIEKKLREATPENTEGTISNISGGGVKFSSDIRHEKGEKLWFEFTLDEMDPSTFMCLQGRVVYADDFRNMNSLYESRVEFVDINRVDREVIVKFVFNEERKLRKREKGL